MAVGDVILNLPISKVTLNDVLLVPSLAIDTDLYSVSALLQAGLTFLFEKDVIIIKKDSIICGTVSPNSPSIGLYYL